MTPEQIAWDRSLCPACHCPDHDPGSCPNCPRCELHTDEAFDWVMRIEPELVFDSLGYHGPDCDAARLDTLTAAVLPYVRHGATCALQAVRDNAPDDELCTCGLREVWQHR